MERRLACDDVVQNLGRVKDQPRPVKDQVRLDSARCARWDTPAGTRHARWALSARPCARWALCCPA